MSKKMGIPKKIYLNFKKDPNYSWNYELREFHKDILKKEFHDLEYLKLMKTLKLLIQSIGKMIIIRVL